MTAIAMPYESRLTTTHVAIAMVTLSVLVYANALQNGFVLDDPGIILRNPLVQEPATAWRAFVQPYWPAEVGSGQYRPLGILSFALDRAIAGNNPAWFHAVNLAWHSAVVVLLYRLALAWLAPLGAAVAAILFAVHPVHVEAVANVVGRLELMAAAFGLSALLLHRRGSLLAVPLFAAALCSKESAIMVPFLAVLADLLAPAKTRAPRRSLYVGYAIATVVWGVMMLKALDGAPTNVVSAVFIDLDLPARLLTVLSIVPHYIRLLIMPLQLSSDYEPDVISPVESVAPSVLLGALLLVAYAVLIVRAWRRAPVVALGMVWIPVALAPVSNVLFATGVAIAERTLYLPSVGLALVIGWIADQVKAPQRQLAIGTFAVTVLGLAALTWMRTPVWRDARTYALNLLEEHPESYRGHWVAGRTLRAAHQLDAADREYTLARRIYARDVALLRESGSLALQLGRHDEARQLNDSAAALDQRRRVR